MVSILVIKGELKGASWVHCVELFRFVSEEERGRLEIFQEDTRVRIILYVKTERKGEMAIGRESFEKDHICWVLRILSVLSGTDVLIGQ